MKLQKFRFLNSNIFFSIRAAYSASKHALQAFSDSLRAEVASSGIKVTVVSPGYIRTNLSLNALTGHGEAHAGILNLNNKIV